MPPQTRMTPEQVSLAAQKQRHLSEERTGVPVKTEAQRREEIGGRKLASILPKVRNRWNGFR